MEKLTNLTSSELLFIEGGCKKCKNFGKSVGKAIKESAIYVAIEDAIDEVASWFD